MSYPEQPQQPPPGYPPAGYAPPPGYPPTPTGYPPAGYPYPVVNPTNGMAVAALVCALAGLVTCVSAPVGAVLGHVARRQIRERGGQGDGMALAGIIVGWTLTGLFLGYLAIVLIFVIAGMSGALGSAVPN
jgi:Domain of unknown function (DUF4190)